LWAIAAHRLGPGAGAHRIASETRRWYEANVATIGPDPSLIQPGQQLHPPTEKGR
jgi:resuscitation-promoting factor RpfA